MHLERRDVDEEAGPDELVMLVMIAQDVADVLTQEALDALAELLHPVDVALIHPPRPVWRVRRARRERRDLLLDAKIPRHVRYEVANVRKRTHRLHGDRLVSGQLVEARHTHQLWRAIDLG